VTDAKTILLYLKHFLDQPPIKAVAKAVKLMEQEPVRVVGQIKQRERIFFLGEEPSLEDRAEHARRMYSCIIGNENAKRRLMRVDRRALKNRNHSAAFKSIALLGPASVGKTSVAKARAKGLGLPFVEVHPRSIESCNDLLVQIARTLDEFEIKVGDDTVTLGIIPPKPGHVVLPPCVVFIDEVHALRDGIINALLKATEKKDRTLVTEAGWTIDCKHVCWMIATTHRSRLFGPFKTRFAKISLHPYTVDEMADIVKVNMPDVPDEMCDRIANIAGRVPREVVDFAEDVTEEVEQSEASWEDACETVRKEHEIDEFGMTLQRVEVLKSLAKGPVSKARMIDIAGCQDEAELTDDVMGPLVVKLPEYTEPLIKVRSGKGYVLTPTGAAELAKRGVLCEAVLAE